MHPQNGDSHLTPYTVQAPLMARINPAAIHDLAGHGEQVDDSQRERNNDLIAESLLGSSLPDSSSTDPSKGGVGAEASASRSTLMSQEHARLDEKENLFAVSKIPPNLLEDPQHPPGSKLPTATGISPSGVRDMEMNDAPKLGYFPRTPYSMNRYILFTIILVYTVCIGSHFFNWPSWEAVFRENDVYGFLCDGTTPNRSPVTSKGAPFCNERKKAMDRLFFIVQACMFSFSFVAGMVLDVIGTKVCCMFGLVLFLLGWTAIAVSSSKCELYPLAFALIGAGTDPAFFGTLSISNVFPENPSLIIALLGAARSVSNLWPKMLHYFATKAPTVFTMQGIALFFCAMYVGCLVLVILLVPSISYRIVARDPTVAREVTLMNKLELAAIGAAPAQTEVEALDGPRLVSSTLDNQATSDLLAIQGVVPVPTATAPAAVCSPMLSAAVSRQLSRVNEGYYEDEARKRALSTHNYNVHASSLAAHDGNALTNRRQQQMAFDQPLNVDKDLIDPKKSSEATRWDRCRGSLWFMLVELKVPFLKLKSPLYFPIVLFSIANILRNGYYLVSAKDRLGSAQELLIIMNLLGFVPGPFCGYLVNRYSPFVVMHGLNVCIGIVFLLVLIAGQISNPSVADGFNYASTVFALPFIGFLLSQVYCYIALVFDPADLGKLAGFASLVAGFCGLATEPMTQLARRIGFAKMDILNLVITVICFFLLWFVKWRLDVQTKQEDAAALASRQKNNQTSISTAA